MTTELQRKIYTGFIIALMAPLLFGQGGAPVKVKNQNTDPVPVSIVSGGGTNSTSQAVTNANGTVLNVRETGKTTNEVSNLPTVYPATNATGNVFPVREQGKTTNEVSNLPSAYPATNAPGSVFPVREQGKTTNEISNLPTVYPATNATGNVFPVREQGKTTNEVSNLPSAYPATNAPGSVFPVREQGVSTNVNIAASVDGCDVFYINPQSASNSTNIIKAGAGVLYGVRAGNTNTSAYMFHLVDQNSQITTATSNRLFVFVVPPLAAGANVFQDFNPIGVRFTNGLAFCISSTTTTNLPTVAGGAISIYYK